MLLAFSEIKPVFGFQLLAYRSFSFSKLDKCFGDVGLNTVGSNRQTVSAPVQELSQTPGKADSPLLAGLGASPAVLSVP